VLGAKAQRILGKEAGLELGSQAASTVWEPRGAWAVGLALEGVRGVREAL
jgi:hypothetical protein